MILVFRRSVTEKARNLEYTQIHSVIGDMTKQFLSFWIMSDIVFSKLFAFGLPGLIQPLHSESMVSTSSSFMLSAGVLFIHKARADHRGRKVTQARVNG